MAMLLPMRPAPGPAFANRLASQPLVASTSGSVISQSPAPARGSLVLRAAAASASTQAPLAGPSEAVSGRDAQQAAQATADLLQDQDGQDYAGEEGAFQGEGEEVQQQEQQPALVEVEVEESEEVVIEEQPLTVQLVAERTKNFLLNTNYGKVAMVGGAALLALTVGIAVKRAWEKANTPRAKRLQQV